MSQITHIQNLGLSGTSTVTAKGAAPGSAALTPTKGEGGGNPVPVTGRDTANSMSTKSLDSVVVQVNDYLQSQQRSLEFSVDKSTGQSIIKVVDRGTGKVLRQIPPEYMVHLAQTLLEQNNVQSTGVKLKT